MNIPINFKYATCNCCEFCCYCTETETLRCYHPDAGRRPFGDTNLNRDGQSWGSCYRERSPMEAVKVFKTYSKTINYMTGDLSPLMPYVKSIVEATDMNDAYKAIISIVDAIESDRAFRDSLKSNRDTLLKIKRDK